MPTPKEGYWLDGQRLPSVTTILSRFKESGGLIHWAWDLGRQGKDYREERDKAGDAGTCAHDMVECYIRKRKFDPTPYPPEILAKANNAFSAFKRWAKQCKLKPVQTELRLISKLHRYGGTLDALSIGGELHLLDWKCSPRIYMDYLLQLAAYGFLYHENNPGSKIVGYDLVRFSKGDDTDFSHHSFLSLEKELELFLLYRKAYDLIKVVENRL